MKLKTLSLGASGYALVVVLIVLLVTMLLGSYFLKKSSLLDEKVQMSLNEKELQQLAVYNFNELAQRVRSRVESAINESTENTPLLSSTLCAEPLTCVSGAMSEQEVKERGISYIIECRGEGIPLVSTQCTTNKDLFPKQLLIRMQQTNPSDHDEVIYATGEVRYQPVPLNAYALALTNAQDVRFGPGTYNGNIAINLSNSTGNPYKIHLYPGVDDPINFNGIVTVSAGQLATGTNVADEAVIFHTDDQRHVNYVGFRTSSQLGNLSNLFRQVADQSLEEPSNTVIEGSPAGYFPEDISLPTVDGVNIINVYTLYDDRQTQIDLSGTSGANCVTNARFQEQFKKIVHLTVDQNTSTLPDGYQFEAGHDYLINLYCRYMPSLCSENGACLQFPGQTVKRCTAAKGVVNEVWNDPLPNNSILVSEDEEVVLDRYNPSDNHASACGVNFAVYAQNGYFKANAGFRNIVRGGESGAGIPPQNEKLTAAFVSGIGSNDSSSSPTSRGAVVFHEGTMAEHGETLGFVRNTGTLPPAGPTLAFEATIVGLGTATSAVKFSDGLISSGAHTLGEFLSKGGQIAARASDYRTVVTSGANAGQIVGGFTKVTHEFVLNNSPVLSAREFAANLDATVQNFNIGFPDAREGLAHLGLAWENTVPNINVINVPGGAYNNWIFFKNGTTGDAHYQIGIPGFSIIGGSSLGDDTSLKR